MHRQPLVTCDTVRFGAIIARGLTIREPLEVAVTFGKGEGFETEEYVKPPQNHMILEIYTQRGDAQPR